MNIWNIIFGLMFIVLLYFSIHLIINRGKIEVRYMFIAVLYSLLIGLPVTFFSLYPERMNLTFYVVYYAVFLLPVYVNEFYNCIKGRQEWRRLILIFFGVNLIILSPFAKGGLKMLLIVLGLLFVSGFFVYLFRYPHLNPMWLQDTAQKAAENIEKNCKYSSKPVVLSIPSKKTSCTKGQGVTLFFKKKNVIVKISKDFHEKLGKPNMERYAEELVRRIKNKIKEEGEIT
jgi:hypothetical protein